MKGRKSNARIEGESALRNLQAIRDLAEENERFEERGRNRTWSRNAGDARRWVGQLKAAGMDAPSFVLDVRSLIGL